ncbi:hypothetical protein MPSEU_000550800 [Mayamaea pseudoterrestris]|nr:hypothetical protein MPSEU_000550800 [Mayamaea pseudoterrestris]
MPKSTSRRRAVRLQLPLLLHLAFFLQHACGWMPASQLHCQQQFKFRVSSLQASVSDDVTEEQSITKADDNDERSDSKPKRLDYPWSSAAHQALTDNVPKYSFSLMLPEESDATPITVTLWRTMSQNTVELAGYPLDFLAQQYARAVQDETESAAIDQVLPAYSTTVLPYLDNFYFTQGGGMRGNVYGLPGVAPGTLLETSRLVNVARTLPHGYVVAAKDDGLQDVIAYELGKPQSEAGRVSAGSRQADEPSLFSLSGLTSKLPSALAAATTDKQTTPALLDPDLMNLGGLTVALLGGAVALETLSHHLTINVFWV